jgi:hypothetical protein
MMGVPAEGTERLAKILREIFALSEPNRPNRSKSTAADDPIEIRVYDDAGNVIARTPRRFQRVVNKSRDGSEA